MIEAVEGPVALNICLEHDGQGQGDGNCKHTQACTMVHVWRMGQEKMLDVYRAAKLSDLAFKPGDEPGLVKLSPAPPR